MTIKVPCPECDKIAAVSEKSQAIGEFIDWLRGEKEYVIACYTNDDEYRLVTTPIQDLLAEFFHIDMKKVEVERRALLDAIREKENER